MQTEALLLSQNTEVVANPEMRCVKRCCVFVSSLWPDLARHFQKSKANSPICDFSVHRGQKSLPDSWLLKAIEGVDLFCTHQIGSFCLQKLEKDPLLVNQLPPEQQKMRLNFALQKAITTSAQQQNMMTSLKLANWLACQLRMLV